MLIVLLQNARRGREDKLWIGQILDQEHGWHWSNGQPYRYMNWDSGMVFFLFHLYCLASQPVVVLTQNKKLNKIFE